jgi:nucleotide-binding universal stress UspA family protein
MDDGVLSRVFVGVDRSIPGLAALRFAVAEARRRGAALHAIRVARTVSPLEINLIDAAFADALGGMPRDLVVHRELLIGPVADTLARRACNAQDVLVVGTDGSGRWHGACPRSISRQCLRKAQCPVLIVPGPRLAIEARRRRWLPHHRELLRGLEFRAPASRA